MVKCCNIYSARYCFHSHMSILARVDIKNYNHLLILCYHRHTHRKISFHHHKFQYNCLLLMEKLIVGKARIQLHILDMLQNYHILNNNRYIFSILKLKDYRKILNRIHLKCTVLMIMCKKHLRMSNIRLLKNSCMFHKLSDMLNM